MIFGVDCADVETSPKTQWSIAKAQGPLSFAILRATYGATVDVEFKASWPRIQAIAVPRGAYLFLRFPEQGNEAPEPAKQVAAFSEVVGPLSSSDLPPILDVEFPGKGRVATGMTAAEALAWVQTAVDALVAQYRVAPMIYTSARVWHEDLGDIAAPALADCPLWLARYFWAAHTTAARSAGAFAGGHLDPPVPPPWSDADNWWIHQYQGDAIGFPGFTSTVDVNRFNPLTEGAHGARVRWLERRLGLPETGELGDALHEQLIAFQRANQLVADGIVGPRTFAALCWQRAQKS